jgi:hypothetical protein
MGGGGGAWAVEQEGSRACRSLFGTSAARLEARRRKLEALLSVSTVRMALLYASCCSACNGQLP